MFHEQEIYIVLNNTQHKNQMKKSQCKKQSHCLALSIQKSTSKMTSQKGALIILQMNNFDA